ncbi:MAG TPA: SDR family oxidoreductase [Acidimicrobiales bacterium]|nr:SDR family oxidoreductase [Acidimicrobiales bacterium]
MSGPLQGKVALVTGSSSGIGAATARVLADAGARVVVNSARSEVAGRALADELPGATYFRADIADEVEARALVAETVDAHGRLDVLVNNAGTTVVIPHSDLASASTDVWRKIFDVNVFGTWQVSVAAVPHLRASGDGTIVNVSSIAGHKATGSSIPYAASKAALSHMTALLANVLGPEIRVNAVAPGLVDTPWTSTPEWDVIRTFVQAQAPLGRSATAQDVAHVILGLVTARYVTGEIVLVDGGMHLR